MSVSTPSVTAFSGEPRGRSWSLTTASGGRYGLLTAVERLALLEADRRQILGVARALQQRLELRQALLELRRLRIAVQAREFLAQRLHVGVAPLGFGERHLAPQLALLALHRLELAGDVHELARGGT